MKEADLAKPVADWLRSLGYTVYAEIWIGPTDLVGYNSQTGDIAIVELKKSATWRVIQQAALKQLATCAVWIGVGTKPRKTSLERCQKYGVGCVSIKHGKISIVTKPSKQQEPIQHYREDLIKEIKLSEPSDDGGLPSRKGIGPTDCCLKAIKRYLAKKPDAGWRELFNEIPNHYNSHTSMACAMSYWKHFSLKKWKQKKAVTDEQRI